MASLWSKEDCHQAWPKRGNKFSFFFLKGPLCTWSLKWHCFLRIHNLTKQGWTWLDHEPAEYLIQKYLTAMASRHHKHRLAHNIYSSFSSSHASLCPVPSAALQTLMGNRVLSSNRQTRNSSFKSEKKKEIGGGIYSRLHEFDVYTQTGDLWGSRDAAGDERG